MPLLKDLSCSIELSDDSEPLQELGTVYGDAFVETFIPVPKKQQTFTVHLSGRNFIAPGIAMYVFIDGVYQCNRNRQNMKLRKPLDRRSLVDFKVRQKEERQKDGSIIAREWTFEELDHASADGAPDSCSPNILENLGCIEVVVLRCAGTRNAKTAVNMNMNMNVDGATDYPDYRFDRDSRSRTTAYDDRDPFVSATSNKRPPPPTVPQYRSPYAETVRSREGLSKARSRYSVPVSPGTRSQSDITAPGFQYGSGPLPARSTAETYQALMDGSPPSRVPKPAPMVDTSMLEKIVADAIKRGVEDSRKNEKFYVQSRVGSRRYQEDLDNSSQVPGAWPTSPTHASKHRSNRPTPSVRRNQSHDHDDYNSVWDQDAGEQKRRLARSTTATHTAWDELTKPNSWGSPDEESWNTDETWSRARPEGWEEVHQRSKSRGRTVREPSPPRRVSYVSKRPHQRRRSKHGRSRESRSKPRSHWVDDMKTSSDDNDGWTQVEALSDTSTSLERSDSTLKPSHSRSQIQQSRSKPSRKSSRKVRSQSRHGRRLSQLVENLQFHPVSAYHASPPSVLVTNAPTAASAPIWQHPTTVQSRKPSACIPAGAPVVAPPPTWGCASAKTRKDSAATTYLPPAAFSTISEEHQQTRQSSGSSSWGIGDKKASKSGSEKKSALKQASWHSDKKPDKANSTWGGAEDTATGWAEDEVQGWGNNSTTGQENGGWNTDARDDNGWDLSNNADEKPVKSWDTDNNNNDSWDQTDTKEAVDGFNPDDQGNGWGHADTSNDDQNNGGGLEDTNNNSWGAAQDTTTAWDQAQDMGNNVALNAEPGDAWAATASPVVDKKEHPSNRSSRTRRIPSVPAEPLYKVPPSAGERGIQHQVLAGAGTAYGHAVSRPEYVDRLDKPYAVFRFKYRSRSVLRDMFGGGCLGKSGEVVGRKRLEALTQEELVRKMLALQDELAVKEGQSQGTESVARGLTEEWVQRHSGEASEKGRERRLGRARRRWVSRTMGRGREV
ncbi:hypothetical protein N0V86_002270 [Didymella sp. IMI 355093]|nr:hypothetical protein N0V86_002270 [Didymella sp. IMI 355093]